MKLKLIAALLLFSLLLFGCVQVENKEVVVKGKIADFQTRQGIAGAKIVMRGDKTLSRDDGSYVLSHVIVEQIKGLQELKISGEGEETKVSAEKDEGMIKGIPVDVQISHKDYGICYFRRVIEATDNIADFELSPELCEQSIREVRESREVEPEGLGFEVNECVDSDAGNNPKTKGVVKVIKMINGREIVSEVFEDQCNGNMLVEFSCIDRELRKEEIKCPGRCTDGACLPVGKRAEPEPSEPTRVCEDDDGGLNYEVRGKLMGGKRAFADYCLDEKTLIEYYCSSKEFTGNEDDFAVKYPCSEACRDGACVKIPVEPVPVECIEGEKSDNVCSDEYALKYKLCKGGKWTEEREKCEFGCSDGTCLKTAPECAEGETKTAGCDDEVVLKLMTCSGGKWLEKREKCEFGCKEGACLKEPVIPVECVEGEKSDAVCADEFVLKYSLCKESKWFEESEKCELGCKEGACITTVISECNEGEKTTAECADGYTVKYNLCKEGKLEEVKENCVQGCKEGACIVSSTTPI